MAKIQRASLLKSLPLCLNILATFNLKQHPLKKRGGVRLEEAMGVPNSLITRVPKEEEHDLDSQP
jgi:hypothetical protein